MARKPVRRTAVLVLGMLCQNPERRNKNFAARPISAAICYMH